ncbi:MAG TPA: hypothetical protein VN914_01055 [Polyangia bacterium]|nr:hypothetical protein [Polyangia bacterium]
MKLPIAAFLLLGCDGSLTLPEPAPPPPAVHKLVNGPLGLVGRTTTGCSSGVAKPGISADVWCAFYRAGGQGGTELWVLNVSKAAARPVACDGASPECLRLTTNLWTGDPLFNAAHPGIHGFEGDTLIIYADASVSGANDAYRGALKVWRPGWTTARTMTSPQGYLCHGNAYAPVAHCLDNVVEKEKNYELDLLAGSLAGSAPGPLQKADHIATLGAKGQIMWSAAFSPDGAWFLYSSPSEAGDTEVLRLAPATDGGVGPPREIRRGASRWLVAPDSKKLYFLDGYNYVDTAPAGALTMVDFPAIAGAAVLQPNVALYTPLGGVGEPDRGLGYLQDVSKGDGTFRILRDRAQPAGAVTIESGVNEFLISPDLRYTFVAKPNTAAGPTSLVVSNEGKGSCVLMEGRPIYSQAFAPDAAALYWAQDSDSGFTIEGWYAPLDGCVDRRRRFSEDLAYLAPTKSGLVYADSDPDRQTMTLKFAPLVGGALDSGGVVVVQERIDLSIARGGARFVVFTVSRGDATGLYAYGPL